MAESGSEGERVGGEGGDVVVMEWRVRRREQGGCGKQERLFTWSGGYV